jgi:hypothetical protein
MGQVVSFRLSYFEVWLLSKLQDVCKGSQDKNTHEARIIKNVLDQKIGSNKGLVH